MNKKSLHSTIREQMLRVIGGAQVGDLLPTEKEIAERFNSSRATVQNVMLSLQREGFIERKKGRGSFVRSKERRIFSGTDFSFGGQVLYAYQDYPALEYLLFRKIVEELARQRQLDMVEARISRFSNLSLIQQLAAQSPQLKGVIAHTDAELAGGRGQRMLHALGVPAVVISGERSVYDNVFTINPDHYKTGYKDVELLAGRGHRRLAYVGNEPGNAGEKLTLEGMRRAVADFGLPQKSLTLQVGQTKPWEDAAAAAYAATREIVAGRNRPGALIYRSFSGALAGLRAIREAGLSVPGDLSVVANSSPLPMDIYAYPRIAYITCRRETVVKMAMDVITGVLDHPVNNLTVDVTVAEEESVGPGRLKAEIGKAEMTREA